MAEQQALMHIIFEIGGILLGLYLIFLASSDKYIKEKIIRISFIIIGIISLIVDGYLLFTWF